MKAGVVTVIREAEEPVASRRRIAGTTTIRGAYPEKAREVGADVFLKGAIPWGTPFLVDLRGSEGAFVPVSPGADKDASLLFSMLRSLRPKATKSL